MYDFVPQTFVLPNEYVAFMREVRPSPGIARSARRAGPGAGRALGGEPLRVCVSRAWKY